MSGSLGLDVVRHHLRLVAADDRRVHECRPPNSATGVHAILAPDARLLDELGVRLGAPVPGPAMLDSPDSPLPRLRTLHEHTPLLHPDAAVVVQGPAGAAWLRVPVRGGELLLVGTALGDDFIRFRQGDPGAAERRPTGPEWGYEGERPNYLYSGQLDPADPQARPADAWALALAHQFSVTARDLLPGSAPGAIVVTGDDDSAYLASYDRQLELLAGLPVTYFLHPETRHDAGTLRGLPRGTELELHPDAIADPAAYPEVLARQARWFEVLTGRRARAVRNHGYLNDGWWGHVPAWLAEGIEGSANVPGVDGTVVTGSLLPARIAFGGSLTPHWSILTAFGDGLVLALGYTDAEAAERLHTAAARLRADGVPGVLVLNLHPENAAQVPLLHRAAVDLVQEGFHPWTLGACLAWFRDRDGGTYDDHA